jgi:D-3-phosphoglycerate dehydrogenase / 2-oxoglutarate reductase
MNALRVWTDVELRPVARQHLAAANAGLIEATEGSLAGLAQADGAIIGSRLSADARFFAEAPRLRALARVGMGYERVDLVAATAAGVCAMNTPAAPTESTAEFAILLMLAAVRRLVPGACALQAGSWIQSTDLQGRDVAGLTLGIVGCGRIGRRVAEIASVLGMKVVVFDPLAADPPSTVERLPTLPALLGAADVVSVHAPLTPGTSRLLGAPEFAAVKRGAVLVNTSRGGLIDESALLAALQSGQVGAAALDVWDPEPPRPDHPLLRHPHVIATPHMAAFTEQGRDRSHLGAATQVLQVLRGERPPHLLNPDAWTAMAAKVR